MIDEPNETGEKVETDETVEKQESVVDAQPPETMESPQSSDDDNQNSQKSGKKPKKKKPKFVDDGRTVFSMEGLSKHRSDKESLGLSKKERRALIKAAFAYYLPILFGVIACFSIAALLIYLWLR